jgi:hypothetical protein
MAGDKLSSIYSTFVRGFLDRVQVHLSSLRHAGQKGTAAERAVADLLLSFLPRQYSVKHDVVLVGTDHELSPQCDLAIIDELTIPRMFPMRGAEMWPIDSCGAVIEVKARLRKADLVQSVEHSSAIRRMRFDKRQVIKRAPQFKSGWGEGTTYPPLHVVWAWLSECDSIETALNWITEALTGHPYNDLPDLIFIVDKTVFLSKTFTWMKNSYVVSPPAEAPEEPFQCGIFRAEEGMQADEECNEDVQGKQIAMLDQGRAVLNMLWSLVTQIGQRREGVIFNPSPYMPKEVFHYSEAPFKFFLSAGPE